METKAILDKKQHGDSVRIAQIANRLARERGLREYSEITVRQQLNGNRTLKKIVKEEIVDVWDHAVLLNALTPHKELGEDLAQKGHKVIECNYQPTCENMLYEIAEKIKNKLPSHVQLAYLKLHETENSYGEWLAEENL